MLYVEIVISVVTNSFAATTSFYVIKIVKSKDVNANDLLMRKRN